MTNISVMLKPVSGECNLSCGYCFYHDVAKNRTKYSHGIMTYETAESAISKALTFADGDRVYLTFQGGEPLLRGKDFYRHIGETVKKFNNKKSEVIICLQTNGTLIDEEWCKIFSETGALLGVSLDGARRDNAFRITKEGGATFKSVLKNLRLLERNRVPFNILTVVTKYTAENIGAIYSFFTENGFKNLQFNACLSPFRGENEYGMDGGLYGRFLYELFSLYYRDYKNGNYVSVRTMDNFVKLAAGKTAEQCGMNGHCTHQFVIESDGKVYPCDFYCMDEFEIGNINNEDFERMAATAVSINFIKESLVLDEKCKECNYFMLCRGGCKRERDCVPFCEAYRYFFPKAITRLREIAYFEGLLKR